MKVENIHSFQGQLYPMINWLAIVFHCLDLNHHRDVLYSQDFLTVVSFADFQNYFIKCFVIKCQLLAFFTDTASDCLK